MAAMPRGCIKIVKDAGKGQLRSPFSHFEHPLQQPGFLNTNILLTLCATRRAQKTEGLPVWAIPLRLNLSKLVLLLA